MKILSGILSLTAILLLAGCSNKAKIDNELKKYFDARNVEGCFTMLDNGTGRVTVYNMQMDTARVLPAGTFHIVNALIGLESGRILNENMVIKAGDMKQPPFAHAHDLAMTQAFKEGAEPYFGEVAQRVGNDTMKRWVDSIAYGNKNIEGPIDSFWLNNHLKISPDEQVGLMKKLYFDQLPFRKSVQQAVRNVMLQEDNTAYKLSYKTGWGFDEENNSIGWLVGWIEENSHVYFFATLLKSKDKNFDMLPARIGITKDILKHYGFFEGKK